MKKFKNFVVLVMALAMFLSAGLGSVQLKAAGNEGSITVKAAKKGKSYGVYKIFDLKYQGEGVDKAVTYTIDENWKEFFASAGKDYIIDNKHKDYKDGLNPIVVDGEIKYINITDNNVAEFAKLAMAEIHKDGINRVGQKVANKDGDLVIDNLPLGYYLVHPEGATENVDTYTSLVSLTSTTPNGEVNIKATYPTITKKVDKQTSDIGAERTFTLESKVPDMTGYSKYIFKITDTLSEGLTFVSGNTDVEVKIGDQIVTEQIKKEIKGQELVVEFEDMLHYKNKTGETITVTYKVKLNNKAKIGKDQGNPNKVILEYSNDPKNTEQKDKTPGVEVKVYTFQITVNKLDGDNNPLKGAKFKLRNENEGKDKGKYYKRDEATGAVTWVDKTEASEVEAVRKGDNYVAEFIGLDKGKYTLIETTVPDGYNKAEDKLIEIKEGADGKVTSIENPSVDVVNKKGVQLPGTGGIGTTIFSVIGGLIILFAVLSLSKSKVKKARN